MNLKIIVFSLTILNLLNNLTNATKIHAQQPGQFGISISGAFSQPIGGLSEWFKSAPNFGASFGQQYNEKWFLEGVIDYSRFDKENLTGYPKGKLELLLEHYGVLVSGKYEFFQRGAIKSYFNIAGGVYYYKGIRGEVQADSTVQPFVPFIAEKKHEEYNWGFRTGLGLEWFVNSSLSLDLLAYYRFVVGNLYSTLQPLIELEGVSGFQTLNLAIALRFYF